MRAHTRRGLPMRNLTGKLVVLMFILLISTHLRAQDVAAITGVVTDPTGAVVQGVSLTLENPSTSVTYKALTNSLGSYTIQNVQPGPGYKITFTAAGFKTEVITDLYLNVSSTRTQNARLTVGGSAQSVEVSAVADNVTLDSADATVGNNFQVQ